MIKDFQFARLPLIFFGPGKLRLLAGVARSYGNSIILVTGKRSFSASASFKTLLEEFTGNNIHYEHVIVGGEPSPEIIDNITGTLADGKFNVVVAIGGGSVLDAGKAISAMFGIKAPVRDFLEGAGSRTHPGTKIPFIAVPTTSGTGSEATKNAVISSTGINGFKRSLRHENFVPDIAIVDPELALTCPPEITAASGMDCFSQLTEAFLSSKSNGYTDALAFEGIKAVRESLLKCVKDGSDIEARSGMAYAALTSGICLANAGLGAVHGFAASIGGMFDIPHGIICGTLMASANEVNVRELRISGNNPGALEKYARLGKLFIDVGEKPDEYYVDGFTDYLKQLTEDLNLPLLGSYGIKAQDSGRICRETETKNNPVKLSQEKLIEIISLRI